MPVIRASQLGSVNQTVNEVVVVEKEPDPIVIGASTNIALMVAQALRGDPDELHTVGNLNDYKLKLGGYKSGVDGYLAAKNHFDANGGTLIVARAVSTGTAAATSTPTGSGATGGVFTLTADSVGSWGNDITMTVTAGTTTGYVDVFLRNGSTTEESFYRQVTTDSSDTQYINTIINKDVNKFVDITMIVTDGTNPTAGDYTFTGGLDGTTTGSSLSDTAYTDKLDDEAKQTDEPVVIFSARCTSTINNSLITHVDDTDLSPRRCTIAFPEATSVATAITNMDTIVDDKVNVVFPWLKVKNPFTLIEENVSPVPFKVGLETLLSYEQSASQEKLPATVTGVEIKIKPAQIATLTKARLNPIHKVKGAGYIYAEDQTSSNNPAKQQQSTRKAKDFFAITFAEQFRQFISKPIKPSLWLAVKSATESFLSLEARGERIGRSDGSKPYSVQIDSVNNPQAIVQRNQMVVDVEVSLLGHADKIYVNLDASIDKTIINTN